MHDMTVQAGSQAMMSSREIAELTGKQHKHVMADIRNMLELLEVQPADFSARYRDAKGEMRECFDLDRYHTEVLVTGYDVKRRAAVIKRWYDLESGTTQPIKASLSYSLEDLTKAANVMADSLQLEGSSRITAMRAFSAANCPELLPMLPAYAIDAPSTAGTGSSEVTHSASYLLKQHGIGMSAAAFNKVCHAQGLLDRQSRTSTKGKEVDFWCITHAGLEYGKNVTSPQSPRQTQPHWYDDRFEELLIMLGIQQKAA